MSNTEETDKECFVRLLIGMLDMEAYRIFDSYSRRLYQPTANTVIGEFYDWLTRIGWKIEQNKKEQSND